MSPVTNALCVDVDDLAGSSIEIGRSLRRAEYCAESEVDSLLADLEALSLKATFFVPGFTLNKWPQLVQRIASAGHDVASHGTTHCFVSRLGQEGFRADISTNKHALEDLLGSEIDTYKAPCWSITTRCLWAYDELMECGFQIDHTAMPSVRTALGRPAANLQPFRYAETLLVIPPTTLNVAGIPLRFCGGFYNAYVPGSLQIHLLRKINLRGLPFNFYFHPYEHSPNPINRRPIKHGSMFLSLYAAHSGVYRRHLRALAKQFELAPLKQSYRQWL